ncbi:hydrogenase accessory protein HypB [Treponema maltophilum ATCC 51939]|uniref:Hydrogenase accessory protein HypB n=1 Tax=Treponema maltophilum ATCC 51939 TaxID=1125699 RepID=S3K251_TREMA|nr:hydrogenase nickel incorporation protein HypB [Treponema maltophilum]EPF30996.1 hydrogenase accessory protein HypB [Treponema maltophilum ATCC 51939]
MQQFKVIEIKKSVYESNEKRADALRADLKKDKIFLLNLMSSPGSGKTTTLMRTIETLKNEIKIGIIEADLDSDVDAHTIASTGAKVIQVHSGGMCHLTADMTRQGLDELGASGLDLVVLENIGNLICTAEFDTGASKNAMILSVPEGDDKPLKYPLMFKVVDVILVNKIDAAEFFNFNLDVFKEHIKKLNPNAKIIPISAKTGEGIERWADYLRTEIRAWKNA